MKKEEWRHISTILDPGTRWRWMVSFMPQPLHPRRKSPRESNPGPPNL
jgi:hypothetical protein